MGVGPGESKEIIAEIPITHYMANTNMN